jgi:hypothetical protein
MQVYHEVMRDRRIRTYGDLANLRSYKFVKSFSYDPCICSATTASAARLKSRSGAASTARDFVDCEAPSSGRLATDRAVAMYWDALTAALADLEITDEEVEHLAQIERDYGIEPQQVRVLHARAFASVISQFINDRWLDDQERRKLQVLHTCLSRLGWAPGE